MWSRLAIVATIETAAFPVVRRVSSLRFHITDEISGGV